MQERADNEEGGGWPMPSVWKDKDVRGSNNMSRRGPGGGQGERQGGRLVPVRREGDKNWVTGKGRRSGPSPLSTVHDFGEDSPLQIDHVGSNPAQLPEVHLTSIKSQSWWGAGEVPREEQVKFPAPGVPVAVRGEGGGGVMLMPVPLKVMMFIDGTWLYYSFFSRGRHRCPIIKQFGEGWAGSHKVDWKAVHDYVCEKIAGHLPGRLVDVTKVVVYGSVKKDTNPQSLRIRMFQDMLEQNFEVHLLTHQGEQEKCVDISLAVDMMHYATVAESYELCVLVTGDKDFMPAMSRVKSKGKRVVLATMRNSCNRDLLDKSKHVIDLDPVFLDDVLDRVISKRPKEGEGDHAFIHQALCDILVDLLNSKEGKESLRDVGRHLQASSIRGQNALDLLRSHYNNLGTFLDQWPDMFTVHGPHVYLAGQEEDLGGGELEFDEEEGDEELEFEAEEGLAYDGLSPSEARDGLAGHGVELSEEDWEVSEAYTGGGRRGRGESLSEDDGDVAHSDEWETYKLADLREALRNSGLRTTGKKAELIARLRDHET